MSLILTLASGRGKFMNAPVNPEGVAVALMTVLHFSSHTRMTNEIQICFSK